MSLLQEINRTNTNKEKTKQVATNIDNKLIELGGEQATDLADVPNKMEVMIKDNYKRVAKGNTILTNKKIDGYSAMFDIKVNTDFEVKEGFLEISIPEFPNWGFVANYKAISNLISGSEALVGIIRAGENPRLTAYGVYHKPQSVISLHLRNSQIFSNTIPKIELKWCMYG